MRRTAWRALALLLTLTLLAPLFCAGAPAEAPLAGSAAGCGAGDAAGVFLPLIRASPSAMNFG